MGILKALILGIVQGLTEFLPVSSSGHLVIFQNLLGLQGNMLFFDTMLHVGTLAAVVAVLWKDITDILKKPFQRLTWLIIVATIPAILAAVLFKDLFESSFEGKYLGLGFLMTSVLLVLAEQLDGKKRVKRGELSFPAAAGIGCMQAVSILPSVSRSGATLAGGLMAGLDRQFAAKFSFLMSIPAILGSVVFQGYDLIKGGGESIAIVPIIVGMLTAAATGFIAIRFMLRLIRRKKLYGFAIYTAILGALVLIDQLLLHIVF